MEEKNFYMPNDKAIYDAVKSAKVSNQSLSELFFKRGIIVSPKTEREELASYYSRMFTGYRDYDELTSNLQSITHREKITTKFIAGSDSREVINAASELEGIINAKDYPKDAFAQVQKLGNEIIITITYNKVNPNKSQLQQTVTKEATITITELAGELVMRSQCNEDSDQWSKHFLELLVKNSSGKPTIEAISLEFIEDAKDRSKFLEDLINNIDGFELVDVSKVSVFNPEKKKSDSGSELGDSDSDEAEDIDSGTHVFKASLNGKGVLSSKEVDLLHSKGFYSYHAVWTCIESSATPDIYEVEVKFEDSENCTVFSQKVKGYYRYISQGNHSTNRIAPPGGVERELHTKIENTARKLISKLTQQVAPKPAS
ncbi:TPA: hypothetical protein NIA41_005956 [Pseudomonas aeruginosa]|uniref:hypothetical protein n=1 Tax=Pseudomonas aeruginosa TaxID=287 RepID=UPI0012985E32|nr:hypothetical protein [Pseudomonas aeruginosa]HCF2462311.1 hypothetical protein [Pseudomonas aeruginosa]